VNLIRALFVPAFVTFAVAVPLACSSKSDPTAQSSCTDLAQAQCKVMAQCDPIDFAAFFANDQSTCVTQGSAACVASNSFNGSGATPATVEACASALNGSSCESGTPAACATPPGTLANGTTCASDAQCAGGECYGVSTTGGCGTCTQKSAPPTGRCDSDSDCAPSQACINTACVSLLKAGSACSNITAQCGANLACTAGDDGGLSGTCVPLPGAGGACSYALPCASGLFCSAQSTCAAPHYVALGATCASEAGDVCLGGSCVEGTCIAFAGVGGSCASFESPECAYGLTCQNGTCASQLTPDKCGAALEADGG
jgi:hypothetical protein